MNEPGGEIDPLLWHACAGRLVHVPPLNAKVFYFPQGHAEHAGTNADYIAANRVPPNIHCRVNAVEHKVDLNTDEVFTKISLVPVPIEDHDNDAISGDWIDDVLGGIVNLERPIFLSKVLTQSDANNGGGFSVPKKLAEIIFPALDYHDDPPVQTLRARDFQGTIWRFRHVYRGRPLRHLLTTGWSKFVTAKRLVAGDSAVFSRAENGEVSIGIRRVKRESVRRIRAESVIEAATLAAQGKPFEVSYYPSNGSTEEFCVRASAVYAAVHAIRRSELGPGRRFKMGIESVNSSGVSWYMGSVNSVRDADSSRWPCSLWRLLEVTWDGDVNFVKRINPWLVQVANQAIQTNIEHNHEDTHVNNNRGNNHLLLFGKLIEIGQGNCVCNVHQVTTSQHENEDTYRYSSDDSRPSPQNLESDNELIIQLFGQRIFKRR
ncbi:auxin response factor 18-like [Humulus lupulus]|uniref:auxin response factor 18-like n=1 Tax=Humulus lupulus TaxID=3486 RepID=UPI002B4183F3|nr:auxin response factor 18-like [Humulus lupulus]